MVDLVGSYQFDDKEMEGGDVFARDPYILRFRCLNTGERRLFKECFKEEKSRGIRKTIFKNETQICN